MPKPRKYRSPGEFDGMVEAYVAQRGEEPLLITGLCLFLGFSSKHELYGYADVNGGEFKDSVARARLLIENAYEERLLSTGGAGPIFGLKALGEWNDRPDAAASEAELMLHVTIDSVDKRC